MEEKKGLETLMGLIDSRGFEQKNKRRTEDFTRKRKLPFREPVWFMLTMTKTSVQNALEDFMAKVREDIPVTQQAFSRARQKIRWEAFAQTLAATVRGSYEDTYKQWNRFRLLAIDGSSLQLPHSRELREYFGTQGNERNEAAKASLLYDLENDLIVAAELERASGNERELAERHIRELAGLASFRRGHEELILFDRGYPSWELIELLEGLGIR